MKNGSQVSKLSHKQSDQRKELIQKLKKEATLARRDMESAQENFDCVSGADQVDICIYELRSAQVRYCSLLRRLKELG